jgi:hypothetical protein
LEEIFTHEKLLQFPIISQDSWHKLYWDLMHS